MFVGFTANFSLSQAADKGSIPFLLLQGNSVGRVRRETNPVWDSHSNLSFHVKDVVSGSSPLPATFGRWRSWVAQTKTDGIMIVVSTAKLIA